MTTLPWRIFLGAVLSVVWALAPPPVAPVYARTLYVRQGGDDANDGSSPAAAVRTIAAGTERAASGDTVVVGPGTYREGDLKPKGFMHFRGDRRGTAVGDAPGDVVLDATGFSSGFECNSALAVHIDGFVVVAATDGIYVKSGSHQAVVSNNVVINNNSNGIYVQDSRDAVVFNNLVYNNVSNGILIASNTDGSPGARVLNNTVYGNGTRGIFFSGTDLSSPNGLVLNNVVEANGVAGIQVNLTSRSGYLSSGNVSFDNRFASGTPIDVTDLQADPLLVDPAGTDDVLGGAGYADDDFHLSEQRAGQTVTSPAIDAGSDLSRRLGLLRGSTRTDGRADRGIVDAGYHYESFSQPPATPGERLRFKKIYVSAANGNDANDGATLTTAVRTLKRAFALARPGNEVAIIGGTYSEGQLNFPMSGKAGRPIVIKAINGARINGSTGQNGLVFNAVSHVVVDGLRVDGAGESGIEIRNSFSQDVSAADNIVLRRVRLGANGRRGLTVRNAAGVRLTASVIENNGSRGVQVEGGAMSIERSTINGNVETGVWAFAGSSVAISDTELVGNKREGVLVEQSDVSLRGGSVRGSADGGARFKSGSTGLLEQVEVLDNTDVGVQAISSVVAIVGGSVRGNSIGVQSFVDPVVSLPTEVTVDGTTICDNRGAGIDAQETAVTVRAADVCANGDGVRQRGGTLDVMGGQIRSNPAGGISATDASRLTLQGTAVRNNQGNGVQAVRIDDVRIEDAVVHENAGDGLTILDSPAARIGNNLIYSNRSSGILLSGDIVGSPDAMVTFNTIYDNSNRGLLVGGDDQKPPSTNARVERNIFRGNDNAGIQVNTLSQIGYKGDFNLSTDRYGADTPVGRNDLLTDPLFVSPESGDFHLSQTAAGQGVSSPAVDAGGVSAAASGMATKTTRTDGVIDRGVVDLGYHYRP